MPCSIATPLSRFLFLPRWPLCLRTFRRHGWQILSVSSAGRSRRRCHLSSAFDRMDTGNLLSYSCGRSITPFANLGKHLAQSAHRTASGTSQRRERRGGARFLFFLSWCRARPPRCWPRRRSPPAPACCGPSSRASPPASTPSSPSRSPRAAQTADQPEMQCSQSSCSQPTTGLLSAPRAVPTSTSPPATPLRPRRSMSGPRGPPSAAADHHHRLLSRPSPCRLTPRDPDRPPRLPELRHGPAEVHAARPPVSEPRRRASTTAPQPSKG